LSREIKSDAVCNIFRILGMSDNLKGSVEGAVTGLLGGLAIGILEADWLRIILAFALIAYAGRILQLNSFNPAVSYRLSFSGIVGFLAVLIGLYINEYKPFRPTPKQEVSHLITKGYTPIQAREIYVNSLNRE
jgi:hypothetical protein